jgi:Arc/MetJ family transcription regulator
MARIVIEIDDELLDEARRLTRARTLRATIETALRDLIRRHKAAALANLAGKVRIGLRRQDLKSMRSAHPKS